MKGRESGKYRKVRYEQKEERRKETRRLEEGKDTECSYGRLGTVE